MKEFEKRIEEYLGLLESRQELKVQDEMLKLILDKEEIKNFEEETGKKIGIMYSSPYHILLVDLVENPAGKRFAYERLIPAISKRGVVLIPKMDDRYVLLRQFRHAIRAYQFAFPRGFAKTDMTMEENAAYEMKEELGADLLSCRYLGKIDADSGILGSGAEVFLCEIESAKDVHGHEGITGYWTVGETELNDMLYEGMITDGFTLSALTLLKNKKF